MYPNFNTYIQEAIKSYWDLPSLTDLNGVTFNYKDVARRMAKLHLLFEAAGVEKGDKVAICGRNSANWSIVFLATLSYGAVAVPILADFKADNIHHIVNHSDSKFLCVGDAVWENLQQEKMPELNGILLINDFTLLHSRSEKLNDARARLNEYFGKRYPERFTKESLVFHQDEPEELALISYTSGSTGSSKGVMLPYRSLWSNLRVCLECIDFPDAGDKAISMLPLAHMYGLMIDLIHMFSRGCHLHFLTRNPSPAVIMEAFSTTSPKLVISVPLILEKIVKTRVFPLLEKPIVKLMMMVPFVDNQLLSKIKNKLAETFGGQMKQMIIGGAPLNKEVEQFLRKIEFPYTVGYGMTECGPLLTYSPWYSNRVASCGQIVHRMEVHIDSPDPKNIPGELYVKGDNVMLGYYKNPEMTEAVLKDGWLNTGDMGVMDEDGFIYIKGRSKNMILGPSGQNIYPEEIEDLLNNMPYVAESLIVEQENKLVALIYPDFENGEKAGLTRQQIEDMMEENRLSLNKDLPQYSQISKIKIYYEEFEKTPKRSIKRYLYK